MFVLNSDSAPPFARHPPFFSEEKRSVPTLPHLLTPLCTGHVEVHTGEKAVRKEEVVCKEAERQGRAALGRVRKGGATREANTGGCPVTVVPLRVHKGFVSRVGAAHERKGRALQ